MPDPTFKLNGTKHDLVVSFPWERQVFIRVDLMDRQTGTKLETWEKILSAGTFQRYQLWITTAKIFLGQILK